MPSQEDGVTAIGDMHRKFVENWMCSCGDMIEHRLTHRETR